MPSQKGNAPIEAEENSFNRWKVIWPAFIIVISSFTVVILTALGIRIDSLMIK